MSALCLNPGHIGRTLTETPCTRETWAAVESVLQERNRQKAKWGTPADPHDTADRPDGTGWQQDALMRAMAQQETDDAAREGRLTWRHILHEEVREAYAETDPAALRAELEQVAAVAVKWIEAIDRRSTDQEV